MPARTWPIALIVAVFVIGPGLLPGALFNLDLVLVPRLDIPEGFWGLGPELPRRLPLWVPIAALSPVVPATVIGKVIMIGSFVGAFTGVARLMRSTGQYWAIVAGALYAFSPFLITRTAVGHFMVTLPYAVLPWVLPTLLRPGQRLDRTFLAALTLGAGGHFGGSIALTVAAVGIVVMDRARWVRALLTTLAAQAAWLVPGVLVQFIGSPEPVDSSAFATAADGFIGVLGLSAGSGFWNTYFQAGATGPGGVVAGAVLLGLAVVGSRDLPCGLRRPLVVLGAIGWLVAASSALPLLDRAFDAATDNVVGLVWREGHRVLALHLIWLAPAAVLGARRLARAAGSLPAFVGGMVGALPAALVVMLMVPSLWGVGGQLEAMPITESWVRARGIVRQEPGTVLALPWQQYFNLDLPESQTRRVLHPLPLYLGGDVLASTDNGLEAGVVEGTDPREGPASALIRQLDGGSHVAGKLSELGVRWIVRIKRPDVLEYEALSRDPGLKLRLDAADLSVFEVRAWRSNAVGAAGGLAEVVSVVPGVATSSVKEGLVWYRAGSGGWMRGWSRATVTPNGLVDVPPGSGVIWQVTTPLSLLAQLATVISVSAIVVRVRRHRPRSR